MRAKLKILNILSFLIAAGVPFFNSWKISGHQFGNVHQITALFVALYLFVGASFRKSNPARLVKLDYSRYFVSFTALIFISLSVSGLVTDVGVQLMLGYFEMTIIYLIACEIIFEESTINSLYYGLMAGFVISVFIGAMQFLKVPGFNLFDEDELNANTSYVSTTDAVDVLRIWGPFGNALTFSFYLSVAGTVLFCFYRYVRKKQFMAWTVFGLTLLGIALTISRMAVVAFIFSIALVHLISIGKRKRIWFMLLVSSGIIVGVIYLQSLESSNAIISRVSNSQDDFKGGRLALWQAGYDIWEDHVLFGIGPGNLNTALYQHGWKTTTRAIIESTPGHVENFYLTILFTFGLIAFVVYLVYTFTFARAGLRLLKTGLKNKELAQGIPMFGTAICFMFNNLINPVLNTDTRIQLLLILPMAVCTALYKKYKLLSLEAPAPILPFESLTF